MTESPKSLYQCSLERVTFRLNCLVYYYKSGKVPVEFPKELEEPLLDIPSVVVEPHNETNHLMALRRRPSNPENLVHQILNHHPLIRHHHHNHNEDRLEEDELNHSDSDDDADDEDSEDKSDHFPLPVGPARAVRSLGEEIVSRILPTEEGFKKAMKKGYHSFVNTFIFGSSSDNDLYDRICNSYRVSRPLCEDILQTFQCKYPLSDRVLNLKIFQGTINQLSNLKLRDASGLSVVGLKFLKNHKIRRLKVAHLPSKCTVNELIDCLSDWSKKNMEHFSVRYCSFSKFNKACIIMSLTQLTNLKSLDVSNTDFNNHGLEIITEDLPRLQSLNISSTKVTMLAPLAKTSHRLIHLYAHNVSASCHDEHIVSKLSLLKRLDLSDARTYLDQSDRLNTIIPDLATLPALTELDISGRNSVEYNEIEQLIIAKQNNSRMEPLRFLGVLETNLNYDDLQDLMRVSKEPLLMTGNGNLQQILESLNRYRDITVFVQKSLLHLYSSRFQIDTTEMLDRRSEIISTIIDILHSYMSSMNIVLVSTACLYIFTQLIYSQDRPLHPSVLAKVVKINMMTIEKYNDNQPVMKNILLTLCSDRILQEISFNRMHCMQLVMDSLIKFQDVTLNRLALAVCSILAAKVPTEQTTVIGQQQKYMKRMLDFIDRRQFQTDPENRDMLFKLALSALWNFTDESPKTCATFIDNQGLTMYIEALEHFQGNNSVETKILGLINNIAEVPTLRHNLINGQLLHHLKQLIHSDKIDISYFSAGIIAQLASDSNVDWHTLKQFDLEEVLNEMQNVILSWQTPNFEMVAYRSFLPFVELLKCYKHSSVQLWALWAIHHVCTKSGSQKYCQMLYDERCLHLIMDILDQNIKLNGFDQRHHRQFMRSRLIDVVTPQCYEPKQPPTPSLEVKIEQALSNMMQSFLEVNHCFKLVQLDNSNTLEPRVVMGQCKTRPNITHLVPNSEERTAIEECDVDESKLSLVSCDCHIRSHLTKNPFLCLPSLILNTFQTQCPRLAVKEFYASPERLNN